METTKPWWQSRTVLIAILTAIIAIAGVPGIDSTMIDSLVTAGLAVVTIFTRATATQKLTLTSNQ